MDNQQSSQLETNKVKILAAAYKGQGEIVSIDYKDTFGIGRTDPVGHIQIALSELVKSGLVTQEGTGNDDGINVMITGSGISTYEQKNFKYSKSYEVTNGSIARAI